MNYPRFRNGVDTSTRTTQEIVTKRLNGIYVAPTETCIICYCNTLPVGSKLEKRKNFPYIICDKHSKMMK